MTPPCLCCCNIAAAMLTHLLHSLQEACVLRKGQEAGRQHHIVAWRLLLHPAWPRQQRSRRRQQHVRTEFGAHLLACMRVKALPGCVGLTAGCVANH